MKSKLALFPTLPTLIAGLTSIFKDSGLIKKTVKVLHRQPFDLMSTFPCEIVTCQLENGRELQIFCKYSAEKNHDTDFDHWGGISYEGSIYQHVLQPLSLSKPFFFGTYKDTANNIWLVIEYLKDSISLQMCWQEPLLSRVLAAQWIGEFHASSKFFSSTIPPYKLKIYDFDYYMRWAKRTLKLIKKRQYHYPWLESVCDVWKKIVNTYLLPSQTIIHGEYFLDNILFQNGKIYPVDWESAAIAAGEIDLAFLTQCAPKEIVDKCIVEYRKMRWQNKTSPEFERRLAAAQLYAGFRWLAEPSHWDLKNGTHWCLEEFYCAGQLLGLV